ncbi:hypothetical protein AB0H28_00020 [Micromonospora sp. NPDC050980]|uniref:hypothetical protein n=1 Tax=Micromonospora sp. NPDC050980 TaxID=3155161 RepID=UPI003400C0D7
MKFWVLFRILAALATVAIIFSWATRFGQIMHDLDRGWQTWASQATLGISAFFVFFFALLSIPFEIYVLRKRRAWHLYASVTVIGFSLIMAGSVLTTPPELTTDHEISSALDRNDRIVAAGYEFVATYYTFWFFSIFITAFISIFSPSRRSHHGNVSPGVEAALDAGPTIAYLGLLLGMVSVVQGYKSNEGPEQLFLPAALGLVLIFSVWIAFAGYRRSRS